MKTEWTFPWRTYDFHFKKEHKFRGRFGKPSNGLPSSIEGVEASIRIVPHEESPPDDDVEQAGYLIITLPLDRDAAKELAYTSAYRVGEQIAFRNGDFRVDFGFISCKRIAETADEEAEIDGKPYSLEFSLEEVVGTPEFDGSHLPSLANAPVELLAQFNETRRDKSPVRQFLGYFKILESLSNQAGAASRIRQALLAYSPLVRHYADLQPAGNFETFVGRLVATRHQCAHLKSADGFGYAPNDPAVRDEVIPQIALLEELAYRCLAGSPPQGHDK